MEVRQSAYLLDILHSAEAIQKYIAGYNQEDFLRDPKTQDAVLRRLLVIGEAAGRLTPETVAVFEGLPFERWQACVTGRFTITVRSILRLFGKLSPVICLECAVISVCFLVMKMTDLACQEIY